MKSYLNNLMLAVLLFAVPAYGDAPKEPTAEYKIKAALIYKLTKFVEWPSQAFKQSDSPLEICIAGNNPFGDALNALEQRKVGKRRIEVVYHSNGMEAVKNSCHMLFLSATPGGVANKIVNALIDRPVLTISDVEHFAEQGGVMQFASQANRIGFIINLDSAKRAKLKIAAPLLYLSTVIQEAKGEGN